MELLKDAGQIALYWSGLHYFLAAPHPLFSAAEIKFLKDLADKQRDEYEAWEYPHQPELFNQINIEQWQQI